MSEKEIEETKVVSIDEKVKKEEKPYIFKELDFDNIFPAMNLINKIGLEKVLKLLENQAVMDMFSGKKPTKLDEEGNEVEDKEEYMKQVGKAVVAIFQLVISCLGNCRNELYELLSSASNLSVEEIGKLKLKYVSSMIMDFIKLDDFKDFFKGLLGSMEV